MHGRQPRSITDGVSDFQSYQPTQKHLLHLKTQLRRRKRHTRKTGISAATREKKTYMRARKVVVTVVTTKLYIYNHMNINNKNTKKR